MTHKLCYTDVDAAVERYRETCGDREAILVRDGPNYELRGRYGTIAAYGARAMFDALSRFCEGYEAGRKGVLDTAAYVDAMYPITIAHVQAEIAATLEDDQASERKQASS